MVDLLRWVNKYIEAYGGDKMKVTVFGMSAGGASVHYHMLSPKSRNLFRNAISLSGSSLNWWANVKHPKKKAEKLFKHFNCQNSDSSKGRITSSRFLDPKKIKLVLSQLWTVSGRFPASSWSRLRRSFSTGTPGVRSGTP